MHPVILLQLAALSMALAMAAQQQALTWPFRNLSDDCFPSLSRARLSRQFHRYNFFLAITFFLYLGEVAGPHYPIWLKILLLLLDGFIYWLIFDIAYALFIGQRWYYLGTATSAKALEYWDYEKAGVSRYQNSVSDHALTGVLGPYAGIYKAGFCVFSIIILNFIIFKLFSV